MHSDDTGADGVASLIGRARLLYARLSETLAQSILALPAEEGDLAAAKARLDLIRAHQKALQTVIDIEVGLEKRRRDSGDADGCARDGTLDLDAARDEIRRRIALLRDAPDG